MLLDCTSGVVSGLLYTPSCPWTARLEWCLVYYIQHHAPRLHIWSGVWFIIYNIMLLDCTSGMASGLLYTTSCPLTAHLEWCLVYYTLHLVPRLHIWSGVWFIIYNIMLLDCTSGVASGLLYTTSCPLTAHLEWCLVYYILHHVPGLHIWSGVWFIIYYIMSLDCSSGVVSGSLYTTSCPSTAHLELCLVFLTTPQYHKCHHQVEQ